MLYFFYILCKIQRTQLKLDFILNLPHMRLTGQQCPLFKFRPEWSPSQNQQQRWYNVEHISTPVSLMCDRFKMKSSFICVLWIFFLPNNVLKFGMCMYQCSNIPLYLPCMKCYIYIVSFLFFSLLKMFINITLAIEMK